MVTVPVVAACKPAFSRDSGRFRACVANPVVLVDQRKPRVSMKGDRDNLQWLEVSARHTCSMAGKTKPAVPAFAAVTTTTSYAAPKASGDREPAPRRIEMCRAHRDPVA